jgi:hypothetical protein
MNNNELKDRVYLLKSKSTPLTYVLPSRHTKRHPLLYFDGSVNRELRYARNQRSPFVDEQDGNFIIEPIIFEDGVLKVPKTDTVLHKFLELHPDNGVTFIEFDPAKDASDDLKEMNYEVDALMAAREIGIDRCEAILRDIYGPRVDKMTSQELRRDIMVFARQNPYEFLTMIDDSSIRIANSVASFFDMGIIVLKNKGKDVYFNLSDNKKKMLTIPEGESKEDACIEYFKTNEGMEVYKSLESEL